MLKLWIQSRVDSHRKFTPDPILKHLCNSKHSHPSNKLQRVWILQSLNTLDSTISPYLIKTNLWLLVLDLIESEAVPAKTAYIQSNASYNSRLDFHMLKTIFHTNNRLFTRNNRLFLSAEAETVLISEISVVLNNSRERYTRTNQFSPYLSSQIDFNRY